MVSWAGGVLLGALVLAPSARAESRGELLYSTHCVACHTTQAHWRDRKLATDWRSLNFEVRRWQATSMLQWDDADVLEVTRYLNDTFYRFPQTADPLSLDYRVRGVRPASERRALANGVGDLAQVLEARRSQAD